LRRLIYNITHIIIIIYTCVVNGTFLVEFRPTILLAAFEVVEWHTTTGRLLHYFQKCSRTARLQLEQCVRTALIYDDDDDDDSENERPKESFKKITIDFFSFFILHDHRPTTFLLLCVQYYYASILYFVTCRYLSYICTLHRSYRIVVPNGFRFRWEHIFRFSYRPMNKNYLTNNLPII